MSPRRAALPIALVLVLFAACLPALGEEAYRAVLDGQAGLFPGAQFKKIHHFPKATVVTFETGEPPASVIAFYKKDMAGRGWNVAADDVTKATASLLLTKNGRRFLVEAQRGLPGRTGFSVSL